MQEEYLKHDNKRLFLFAALALIFFQVQAVNAATLNDIVPANAYLDTYSAQSSEPLTANQLLLLSSSHSRQVSTGGLHFNHGPLEESRSSIAQGTMDGSEDPSMLPEAKSMKSQSSQQSATLEQKELASPAVSAEEPAIPAGQKQDVTLPMDALKMHQVGKRHFSQLRLSAAGDQGESSQPNIAADDRQTANSSQPVASQTELPEITDAKIDKIGSTALKKNERRPMIDTAYPFQEKERQIDEDMPSKKSEEEPSVKIESNEPVGMGLDATPEQPSILSSVFSKLKFNGYLKNETAYRYREPRSITKIRNIAYLSAVYPFSSKFRFNFSGWAYYDLAYDLFDYDTIAARLERNEDQSLAFIFNLPEDKDSPVVEAREVYLDMLLDGLDIRIGKQIVVWGVLEGVRITDEINPMDFRELILPELLDYRMPLWTAKMDLYRGDTTYEFLWIPDIKFHKPAPSGSEWELLQEVPGTRRPESFDFKNSEVGFKVSSRRWDTEFSLSYFYTWDDFPSVFRAVRMDQVQNPIFLPTFTRMSIYGATLTKQMWSTIVKFETAFVADKYFGVESVDRDNDGFLDNWGEFKRNSVRWGLGIDFNLWSTDFSPSFTQTIILNYDEAIIQDHFDSAFNIFLRKELPEASTIVQLLGIYLINLEEIYLKPKVIVRLTDRFNVAVGLDIFRGRRSQFGVASSATALGGITEQAQYAQFVGNFHDNDRLFVEFKYAF